MSSAPSSAHPRPALRRRHSSSDCVRRSILYAGPEVVEFSPTDNLGETMEVVTKNMEAAAS
jgi:hypothetical protein